jgi:hypothetical protein
VDFFKDFCAAKIILALPSENIPALLAWFALTWPATAAVRSAKRPASNCAHWPRACPPCALDPVRQHLLRPSRVRRLCEALARFNQSHCFQLCTRRCRSSAVNASPSLPLRKYIRAVNGGRFCGVKIMRPEHLRKDHPMTACIE